MQMPSSQSVTVPASRPGSMRGSSSGRHVAVDRFPVTRRPRPRAHRPDAGHLDRRHRDRDPCLDVAPRRQAGAVGAREVDTDVTWCDAEVARHGRAHGSRRAPSHNPSRAARRATSRATTRAVTCRSDQRGNVSDEQRDGQHEDRDAEGELGGNEPRLRPARSRHPLLRHFALEVHRPRRDAGNPPREHHPGAGPHRAADLATRDPHCSGGDDPVEHVAGATSAIGRGGVERPRPTARLRRLLPRATPRT